jgi:hypothetical protein
MRKRKYGPKLVRTCCSHKIYVHRIGFSSMPTAITFNTACGNIINFAAQTKSAGLIDKTITTYHESKNIIVETIMSDFRVNKAK